MLGRISGFYYCYGTKRVVSNRGAFGFIKNLWTYASRVRSAKLDRALESIADNHLVIELNAAGWRKPINECYPSEMILQKAFARGIEITFGSDSHTLEHIGFRYETLCALAKKVGYTQAVYFKQKEAIRVEF